MSTDLLLVGNLYQWLLNAFYISYIIEFTTIMWKIVPPHIWASIVVFGWGLIATVQASTTNWAGMMACRFFLGAAEAGFGPGIPYLLSFFYLRHELGLRIGIFLSAAPLANTFAGALAYGITSGQSKLANWRLLFLVEGLPTILMSPVAFFFLPDTPDKARFLNEEERVVAKARGVRQVGHVERIGGVDWKDVLAALVDIKNWLTAVSSFEGA
jgi:MFS family permease